MLTPILAMMERLQLFTMEFFRILNCFENALENEVYNSIPKRIQKSFAILLPSWMNLSIFDIFCERDLFLGKT